MAERIPNVPAHVPSVPSKSQFNDNLLSDNSVHYIVEIEGIAVFAVDSVSGLGIETQIVEYTDGDDPLTRKRPGRFTYNNVTIHNIPIRKDLPIYNWVEYSRKAGGEYNRKTMAIIMMVDGKEIRRWNCFHCFPVSFNYHKMEAKKSLFADMVIAIEWFEDA